MRKERGNGPFGVGLIRLVKAEKIIANRLDEGQRLRFSGRGRAARIERNSAKEQDLRNLSIPGAGARDPPAAIR